MRSFAGFRRWVLLRERAYDVAGAVELVGEPGVEEAMVGAEADVTVSNGPGVGPFQRALGGREGEMDALFEG